FKLPHGKGPLVGVPVIGANMDSVGTLAMARALGEHQMFTAVHKYYSLEEWQAARLPEQAFVTFGMESVDKITTTLKTLGRDRL
ncbi:hypothetical protein NL351_29540, partial [Klebsiella pneumoniae]|nr:hypothetical protein [Klebsiella pneumoniae]